MFNKKNKREYYYRIARNGDFRQSGSSGDRKVSSDNILATIQSLYERDGKVVVDFIDDETINLTTLNTYKDDELEERLDEIKQVIKDKLGS